MFFGGSGGAGVRRAALLVRPGTGTMPQFLGKLGYRVALAGKTHIGPEEAYLLNTWSGPATNNEAETIPIFRFGNGSTNSSAATPNSRSASFLPRTNPTAP